MCSQTGEQQNQREYNESIKKEGIYHLKGNSS